MSDSANPSSSIPSPPLPPLPPSPAVAATPAGQRVQGWSNRAWRAFGTTPWWRLVAGGMIVIIGTVLLAVPFDAIRIANKIRSQAAKDALRNSLQLEVLERARDGLLIARGVAVGSEQAGDIDAAIEEVERQLARPIATERFDGSLRELLTKIDAERTKRNEAVQRLNVVANKFAASKPEAQAKLAEQVREITEEIETANERMATFEEQRVEMETERATTEAERATEEAERAATEAKKAAAEAEQAASRSKSETGAKPSEKSPSPVPPKAPNAPAVPATPGATNSAKPIATRSLAAANGATDEPIPNTVTVSSETKCQPAEVGVRVFGRELMRQDCSTSTTTVSTTALGFQPGEPSAQRIRETVSRDVRKLIIAGTASALLVVLFLFMLIARSFAGRAARGEQRAVIAESRERTESHARQLAEARLTLMRAQVEPHFLFNTLAHVQALQEIDPPQASTMLERLISYLRAAMPSMRETKSTLGREVEVVRAYLDLLKIRMGDRLKYSISVPADLNEISLPPTMIATLVENAIKHGLEPKREGGNIAVQVRKLPENEAHAERLEVLVADDGLGFGGADTSGTGVGLVNTRERLKMLYGSQAELVVEPNAPSGVRAIIRVPVVAPETIDVEHDDPVVGADAGGLSPFTVKTVVLLALCFGWLGVHRFYVGLTRSGLAQTALGILSILSGGVIVFLAPLVVWVVLDVVWIATREFRDARGLRISRVRSADGVESADVSYGSASSANVSPYTLQVMAPLALFLGVLGVHRFYVGRYRTGALQAGLFVMSIVTGGLPIFLLPLVMWIVLDLAWILSRDFRDAKGRRIMRRDSDDKRSYSATQALNRRADPSVSQSSRGIALLLAIPLGWCGVHRFYVGRVGTGVAMLFTLGGLGIWWIVDIVMVAAGQLKDMDGKWVSEWE